MGLENEDDFDMEDWSVCLKTVVEREGKEGEERRDCELGEWK